MSRIRADHISSQASRRTNITHGCSGSGIGLLIFRELVELQSGKIGVASKFGVSSTFRFCIKYRRSISKNEEPFNSRSTRDTSAIQLAACGILLVGDDMLCQRALWKRLLPRLLLQITAKRR